jgi:phasin family protein
MNTLTTEQVVAAQKANIEVLFGLTEKAYAGIEKLVELNMQVARTALAEAAEHAHATLSVKDAQDLLALQQALLQPAAEKAAAYSRHLYEIASSTQGEFAKVAQTQFADAQKALMSMVDDAIRNAPAGTESAASLVKSAVTAANHAIEGVQKAAQQAADMAEANFQAASTAAKAAAAPAKGRRG